MLKPHDDPNIQDDDVIIRRINPIHQTIYDSNIGATRISSAAYSPSSGVDGGMSVDHERVILACGHDPVAYVTNPTYICSVWFSAGEVRALGLRIGYEPLPDNSAHGEVWPTDGATGFSKKQKKGLASSARWYRQGEGIRLR